jgi:hypothetical protein
MKLEFSRHIFEKRVWISNFIKIHQLWVEFHAARQKEGRMDWHYKANSRFSQFCERVKKQLKVWECLAHLSQEYFVCQLSAEKQKTESNKIKIWLSFVQVENVLSHINRRIKINGLGNTLLTRIFWSNSRLEKCVVGNLMIFSSCKMGLRWSNQRRREWKNKRCLRERTKDKHWFRGKPWIYETQWKT